METKQSKIGMTAKVIGRDRYAGTVGVIVAKDGDKYTLSAETVMDYGQVTSRPGWQCLIYRGDLRLVKPSA